MPLTNEDIMRFLEVENEMRERQRTLDEYTEKFFMELADLIPFYRKELLEIAERKAMLREEYDRVLYEEIELLHKLI